MKIHKGSTDVTIYFKLIDLTAGTPETGLIITDLDATYVRDFASAVKNDLTALASITAPHSDNKAYEVDATNCPGLYRVDWPDAAFDYGVDKVQLCINGAEIDPAIIEVELEENKIALETDVADDNPDGASVDATFTLTDGSSNDDEYNNMIITVSDVSGGVSASRRITDYTQSDKKITVDYPFEFPIAIGDRVTIWKNAYAGTIGTAGVDEIASAVLDELLSNHKTQGTVGKRLIDIGALMR